mgnify:CR=1 FL=1
MAAVYINRAEGDPLDLDLLPSEEADLIDAIAGKGLILDPLLADESDVDPDVFLEEMEDYVVRTLKLAKKPVAVKFEEAGAIGGVSFWVFSAKPTQDEPLYLFLIRDRCFSEITAAFQWAEVEGGTTIRLTPAEAAVVEYRTMEFNPDEPDR